MSFRPSAISSADLKNVHAFEHRTVGRCLPFLHDSVGVQIAFGGYPLDGGRFVVAEGEVGYGTRRNWSLRASGDR